MTSVTANTKICSAHFKEEDYDKGDARMVSLGLKTKRLAKLIPGTVPSVHAHLSTCPAAAAAAKCRKSSAAVKRRSRSSVMAATTTTPRKKKKYDLKFKLSVIKFAEQNSGEAAARHFSVDPKGVREWRKRKAELQRLSEEDGTRSRLRGGGRKKSSEELELRVCEWIHSMRARHRTVSRRMIRKKAKEIHATLSDGTDVDAFAASAGWLDKFLQRNKYSCKGTCLDAQVNNSFKVCVCVCACACAHVCAFLFVCV